jgi:RNA polymerase sigma factor (sigma-70 family)
LLQRLLASLPSFLPSPEAAVETKDLVEWLLAGLNDRERKLLVLKYYRGLSMAEAALDLDMSEGAAHQLHHRALKKLREKIKNSESGA